LRLQRRSQEVALAQRGMVEATGKARHYLLNKPTVQLLRREAMAISSNSEYAFLNVRTSEFFVTEDKTKYFLWRTNQNKL
jgi:hypothetical protein